MKKSVVFFLFAILEIASVAQNKGIRFENEPVNFDKILEKAKKENKIVFADCYTSWCGPCKWMAKNVFTNDTVGDFFNSNFICVKIDMEKGEGPEIANRYEIGCYPTFLFLDSDRNVIYRISGSCSVEEFFEMAKKAISQEKPYYILKKEYEKDSISREELVSYMKLRQASCLGVEEEVKKYFENFKSDPNHASLDWSVIKEFGIDINSPTFKFLVSNKEIFYSVYTEDSVNQVIGDLYSKAMRKCIYVKNIDTAGYINLRSELVNLNIGTSNIVAELDLGFYQRIGNWKKYANAAVLYIDRYLSKDDKEYMMLNEISWVFYEHIDAGIYLDLAIGWAKRSVELQKNVYNTDTYASLLFKRHKYEEALKVAEEAVQLQKEAGQKPPVTEELLNKIKIAIK